MAGQRDDLTARLDRVEDLLAVHEVIAGYGLTADGGSVRAGGSLWTEDCEYDSDADGAHGGYHARAGIEALIDVAGRAEMGFAHITQLPLVVVEGDAATAHGASYLPVSSDGNDFSLSRVSANAWELVRVEGRWQMQRRTSRTLNGSLASKEVFADGARRAAGEREAKARRGDEDREANGAVVQEDTVDLAEMDRRLRLVEDKLAILQVVAGYGPSVDGGASTEAGSLWTIDSWYDTDASPAAAVPHGRAGIEGAAQRFLDDPVGLAHISHMPMIKVDGDRATVVNHSNTFEQDGDGYRIGRVSANRWDLVRIDGTWQIEHRVNRLLDGTRVAKDLLAEGVRTILGPE
jgi:hypothetical protein